MATGFDAGEGSDGGGLELVGDEEEFPEDGEDELPAGGAEAL